MRQPDTASPPAGDAPGTELLGGASPNEEDALCRRLAPRIRLYGLRHLRDPAAAADLVQQVLATTIESLRSGRVRRPERLESFVLGACRRAASSMRRGERRRQELLERFPLDLHKVEPDPGPSLDGERVEKCFDRLTRREQMVLKLTFYAERRSDEIGRDLSLSPQNVRVIRHRALLRLRRCLEGNEQRP